MHPYQCVSGYREEIKKTLNLLNYKLYILTKHVVIKLFSRT